MLNDSSHQAITEAVFSKEVTKSAYIYLYSREAPPSFGQDPYSNIPTDMSHLANVFRKEVNHSERSKNPLRAVKKGRESDAFLRNDQVSMKNFIKVLRKGKKNVPQVKKKVVSTTTSIKNAVDNEVCDKVDNNDDKTGM